MAPARTAAAGFVRLLCRALVLSGFASPNLGFAASPDCSQADCTAPIPVWQYSLCDDAPPYAFRNYTWCTVMGGTWNGSGCVGAPPLSESSLYPDADSFERQIHNVKSCPMTGQDGGWLAAGQTINSWNCWSGGPVVQNGVEMSNLREMQFSGQSYNNNTGQCEGNWSERVVARRELKLGCPEGYALRSDATGQVECDSKCPVPDLTELEKLNAQLSSNDPDTMPLENSPINTARLTDRMKIAYLCFVGKVNNLKVPVDLASAFRTEAYQRHLWEIWDRWQQLKSDNTPECRDRKAKVKGEFDRHGLGGLLTSPAYSAGNHPRGVAVDISRKTTMSQLETIMDTAAIRAMAAGCSLAYPMPVQDRGHFELQ